jgi:hypothetical protein
VWILVSWLIALLVCIYVSRILFNTDHFHLHTPWKSLSVRLKKVPATSQARDNRIPTVAVAIVFIAGSLVADNDFGRWCRQFLDFLQGGTKR